MNTRLQHIIRGPYCKLEQLVGLRVYSGKNRLNDVKRLSTARHAGEKKSRIRGRGINFEEVRQYQPGDDVRNIDWRVTARTQKTHTKIFHEEKEKPVFIILDQGPSMFFGSKVCFKSVMAAQLASLIAWSALDDNERVGGLVFNHAQCKITRAGRNKRSVLAMLNEIEQFNHALSLQNSGLHATTNQSLLDEALLNSLKSVATGCRIFIFSDFSAYSTLTEKHLVLLARHHSVSSCMIYDPLEPSLPKDGQYAVSDGGSTLYLSNNDHAVFNTYSELWQKRLDQIAGFHRKHGLFFDTLSTDEDPLDTSHQIYGARS